MRKYIDHPENRHGTLNIAYGRLHGTMDDVVFAIIRGRKVLVADAGEFSRKIILVSVERFYARIGATAARWAVAEIKKL